MPITEYYSKEEEKQCGYGATFQVRDELLIFDRRLADAINHLYNHIHVLVYLASSCPPSAERELEFLAQNHPGLKDQARSLLNELSKRSQDSEKLDTLRFAIIHCLLEETKALTEISVSMAQAIQKEQQLQDDKSEGDVSMRLEQRLAQISFIDYHEVVQASPSIVKVISL